MTKWVALLRGVNVGGITVKSAELGALFRELGFDGVKTVLASGNVLFESDEGGAATKDAALKARIEKGLGDRFGYDAWIVLLDHGALAGIVDGFPFEETERMQPYVVFTSDSNVLTEITEEGRAIAPDAGAGGPERTSPGEGVLYWEVAKGSSTDTPFAKYLAKARFKSTTTTRNLRTLRKLL